MMGNELARQFMASMRLQNINKLGSLRVLKGKKDSEEVGKVEASSSKVEASSSKCGSKGTDSTTGRKGSSGPKKRRRRKKKNW